MVMKLSSLTGSSLLLLMVMGNAAADCPVDTEVLPVNFGKIMLSPDDSVGKVLAQETVSSSVDTTDCNGLKMLFSGQPDSNGTYSSGLKGVGYRIRHQQQQALLTMPVSGTVQIGQAAALLIELVKTGEPVDTGPVPAINVSMNAPHFDNRTVISLNIQAAISITTCALKTPDITVPLPTVDTSVFAGRGMATGDTDFSIDLYCYDGTSIDITFEPGDPGNSLSSLGVLAPTMEEGSATGVGVQLLYQGQPVTFLQALQLPQQRADLTLPFRARYYQMTDEVSAGSLRAMAKFSLSYQ